jgi:hypothetical protein
MGRNDSARPFVLGNGGLTMMKWGGYTSGGRAASPLRRSRVTRGEVVRGSSSVSASLLCGGHILTGTIRHLRTTCMRRQLWSCSSRRSTLSSSRHSHRLRPDRLRRPSSSGTTASPRARITPTCRRARIPGSKSPRGRSDEVGANCSVNDTARTDVASRRARAVLDTVL